VENRGFPHVIRKSHMLQQNTVLSNIFCVGSSGIAVEVSWRTYCCKSCKGDYGGARTNFAMWDTVNSWPDEWRAWWKSEHGR